MIPIIISVVIVVLLVMAIVFDVISVPRFMTELKLSKQEQTDRKVGHRIVFEPNYGDRGRWVKEVFNNGMWEYHGGESIWYPAILLSDNMITAGCFYGSLEDFHHRIKRRSSRPQEAIDYYTSKYKEYEDVINSRTQVKSVEQA